MCKFDIISWVYEHYRQQCYDINNQYFTIDTAEPDDVYDWVNHNRLMVTYALCNDKVHGFFNVMPLTKEAGNLFERDGLKEEDITTAHILTPDVMAHAQYLYFPAIASRAYQRYQSRQCTAALIGALASHLLAVYTRGTLKKIFANPTTFQRNRMIRKLGLQPLSGFKKPLTGNDLYYAEFDDAMFQRLHHIQERYARFIGTNCWADGSWKSLGPKS